MPARIDSRRSNWFGDTDYAFYLATLDDLFTIQHPPFLAKQLLKQDAEGAKTLARSVMAWTDAHNLAVKDLDFVMAEFRAKRVKLEEQATKPIINPTKKARLGLHLCLLDRREQGMHFVGLEPSFYSVHVCP